MNKILIITFLIFLPELNIKGFWGESSEDEDGDKSMQDSNDKRKTRK